MTMKSQSTASVWLSPCFCQSYAVNKYVGIIEMHIKIGSGVLILKVLLFIIFSPQILLYFGSIFVNLRFVDKMKYSLFEVKILWGRLSWQKIKIIGPLKKYGGWVDNSMKSLTFFITAMNECFGFTFSVMDGYIQGKADNGFPKEIGLPVALQPYKGYFHHKLLVWTVGMGTSMTRDMSGFHDPTECMSVLDCLFTKCLSVHRMTNTWNRK